MSTIKTTLRGGATATYSQPQPQPQPPPPVAGDDERAWLRAAIASAVDKLNTEQVTRALAALAKDELRGLHELARLAEEARR